MADGARERLDLAGAAAGATFAFRLALAIVDACVVSPRGGDTTFSAPPPMEKWASCVSSPAAASAAEKCPCAAELLPRRCRFAELLPCGKIRSHRRCRFRPRPRPIFKS